jgi:hypothetical protein
MQERIEVIRLGNERSIQRLRPNRPDEYFGVRTFVSFLCEAVRRSKVKAYRGKPESSGVIGKAELFEVAEKHFGHAFSRVDLEKIKARGSRRVLRWRRTLAWAKVVCQHEDASPRIIQRGKWVVLCESPTHQRWIDWAMEAKKKRARKHKIGKQSLKRKKQKPITRQVKAI